MIHCSRDSDSQTSCSVYVFSFFTLTNSVQSLLIKYYTATTNLQLSQVGRGRQNDEESSEESSAPDQPVDTEFGEILQRCKRLIERLSVFPQYIIENYPLTDLSTKSIAGVLHKIAVFIPFSLRAELGLLLRNRVKLNLKDQKHV